MKRMTIVHIMCQAKDQKPLEQKLLEAAIAPTACSVVFYVDHETPELGKLELLL
jgi:hypothetical protein